MVKRLFCFSQREFDALLLSRGEDWRVYLALRKRADFGSGRLQHPSALRLTAAGLARELSLPSSKGQPALTMTRLQVSRAIRRLAEAGLIDEFKYSGAHIRLRLPLAATDSPVPGTDGATSIHATPDSSQKPIRRNGEPDTVSRQAGTALSGSRDTTGGGMTKREAETEGVRLIRGNSGLSPRKPVDKGIQPVGGHSFSTQKPISIPSPHYPEGNGSPSAKPVPPPSAACSQPPEKCDRFRGIVEESGQGRILYAGSPTSRTLYRNWEAMGVRDAEIREAIRQVLDDHSRQPTPNAVDKEIRASRKSRNGAGRGSLVL